jgi:hypothetical protein
VSPETAHEHGHVMPADLAGSADAIAEAALKAREPRRRLRVNRLDVIEFVRCHHLAVCCLAHAMESRPGARDGELDRLIALVDKAERGARRSRLWGSG